MPISSADMVTTERGRLFARDCGPTEARDGSRMVDSYHTCTMVGVVEIPDEAAWRREHVHDFLLLASTDAVAMIFDGDGHALPDHAAVTDLGALQHDIDARMPGEAMRSLGWGGGAMVLRDTRAPSPAGTKLAQIMVLASIPKGGMPDGHMVSMSLQGGRGAPRPATGSLVAEEPCTGFAHIGAAMSQIHKAPLWGWGDELHGFVSTLRLDVIDDCTRLEALMTSENPDPVEVARLRRATLSAVQDGSDPVYAAFRRRMTAEGHVLPWDATPTASQTSTRRQALSILVSELTKAR